MIKISVIIPIYNGENYVKNCIENLKNQTFKEIEILLINDGSKDSTLEILESLKTEDKRITVINKKNEGVSIARNLGIKKAKGEYITFIDVDDYIEENYLENLYKCCIEEQVKISICTVSVVNEEKKILVEKKLEEGKYNYEKALKELFSFKNLNWGPCGKMFHKSVVEDINFPNIETYEDLIFVYKCIYKASEIYFTNKCSYYYMHRENVGAMVEFKKSPTTDVIVAGEEVLEFVKNNVRNIWDESFYGVVSQILMYIKDIKIIDKEFKKEESKEYILKTRNLLKKYKKEIIKSKIINYKEKILFLLFAYSIKEI